MKRREFITLLGSAAVSWPLAARADQTRMPVIGIVGLGPNPEFVAGFRQGLAEAGYVPGQNVAIEVRWANNSRSLPGVGARLVERMVGVLLTVGLTYADVGVE